MTEIIVQTTVLEVVAKAAGFPDVVIEIGTTGLQGPPGTLPPAAEKGLILGTAWDPPHDPEWGRSVYAYDWEDADKNAQVYVANSNQAGIEVNLAPGKRASVTAYGDYSDEIGGPAAALDLRAERFTLNGQPWNPDTSAALTAHETDTTNVHGITDTAQLATAASVAAAVTAHETDTTNVHGITDTAQLATAASVAAAVTAHETDTTNVHGITDTAQLATAASVAAAVTAHETDTTNVHGITDTAQLATAASVAAATGALPMTRPRAHSGSWAKVLGFYIDTPLTLNEERCMPILLAAGTLDRMSLYITVAGAAGARVRLGIRSDNGSGYPGAVLLDAGQINSDGGAGTQVKTVSQVIPSSGLYWFTATAQVAACSAFCVGYNSQPFFELMPRNEWEIDVSAFVQSGVTGALGTFTATRTTGNRGPMVMARYA